MHGDRTPVALTIAGSDPSGGAGVQADLKTFHQRGVYGMAAITLLTVQNTQRVDAVVVMEAGLVARQIDAVIEDIPPDAVKTGALGSAAIVRTVAQRAARMRCPLVVDPVMFSTHGAPLLAEDARGAIGSVLLPHALLVTPNLREAAALSGLPRVHDLATMERAARAIVASTGVRAVLVTGGHLQDDEAVDLLLAPGGATHVLRQTRIDTTSLHGTGCTLSAAITAELARGHDVVHAVARAKHYVTQAIRTAPRLGHGAGPLNHRAET